MDTISFRSVLALLEEHIDLREDHVPANGPQRPLFDPNSPYCTLPLKLPDVASRLSTLPLPEAVSHQLNVLLANDLHEDRVVIEQARQRLLQRLCTASMASDPSTIPQLVQVALEAYYSRAINTRMNILQDEIRNYDLDDGSESESGESSSSEQESALSGDEDGDMPEGADEDDNSPVRPGEDIPPLDTKYLPIFEALHERGKVLTKPEKTYLVELTGMTYRQITIWFQNRRRGELKEDLQLRATSSHPASVHSLDSSDASEDEVDLEQRFSNVTSDTTFDIRSWRLTSALPAKNSLQGSSFPSSPTKFTFGSSVIVSDGETDDTDLSDLSDGEVNTPPGLRVPSLSTSFTTADSASLATTRSILDSAAPAQETGAGAGLSASSRPVKPLPPSRRTSPQARGPAPAQQAPAFSFNFAGSASAPAQNQFLPTSAPMPAQPAQFVTSNERGLTVEMDNTPPTSATTLQSSSSPSAPTSFANTSMPVVLPSSPPLSAGSPHSASSPTPPAQSATSPRPAIKPLPRRTGCAPRPRPPPRAGSVSTPAASTVAPSSARSSVVLPPSSNPSLGNTTLGALLRPNPPAPKIPVEMEDRLSAMAGRMGVGSNPNPARRGTTSDTAALARTGAPPGTGTFPSRGPSFSFGPPMLPGASAMPGSTLAPITGQQAQGAAVRSPTSS